MSKEVKKSIRNDHIKINQIWYM